MLFGATVLGSPDRHTAVSRRALRVLNRHGVFHNLDDTEAGLRAILGAAFDAVEVEIVGAVAVFRASRPRTGGSDH